MCDMIDINDIIANDDHEMLECEECEECFPDYEDFKTQDDFKFCVPAGYYCEACSENLIEKKEEEEEEDRYCECTFPTFIVRDGIQYCEKCGFISQIEINSRRHTVLTNK